MDGFLRAWGRIDRDRDDVITEADLRFYANTNNLTPNFVTKWLTLFDENNTGEITYEHFCHVLGMTEPAARKYSDSSDVSDDGNATRSGRNSTSNNDGYRSGRNSATVYHPNEGRGTPNNGYTSGRNSVTVYHPNGGRGTPNSLGQNNQENDLMDGTNMAESSVIASELEPEMQRRVVKILEKEYQARNLSEDSIIQLCSTSTRRTWLHGACESLNDEYGSTWRMTTVTSDQLPNDLANYKPQTRMVYSPDGGKSKLALWQVEAISKSREAKSIVIASELGPSMQTRVIQILEEEYQARNSADDDISILNSTSTRRTWLHSACESLKDEYGSIWRMISVTSDKLPDDLANYQPQTRMVYSPDNGNSKLALWQEKSLRYDAKMADDDEKLLMGCQVYSNELSPNMRAKAVQFIDTAYETQNINEDMSASSTMALNNIAVRPTWQQHACQSLNTEYGEKWHIKSVPTSELPDDLPKLQPQSRMVFSLDKGKTKYVLWREKKPMCCPWCCC